MAAEHVPSTSTPHRVRLLRSAAAPPRLRCRPRSAVFEQVGQSTAGGVTWLWARADLDMATVAGAQRELCALVAPGRDPGSVLVYLGPERFVDLRGLRLLVDTARRVRARGGDLAVVAPPRCLRRLVRLGRVDDELPLMDTARRAAWWARTRGTGIP